MKKKSIDMKYIECTTCKKKIYIGEKVWWQKVDYIDLPFCFFDCLADRDEYFKRLPLREEDLK